MEFSTGETVFITYFTTSVITGTYCNVPRLLRIELNDPFDKPFGRYLRNSLFDQTQFCSSCKEPTEAHITNYSHRQWNLTFNVRRIPSLKLEGKEQGKIWTWQRCLICEKVDGIPPVTRRTVISHDGDEGLSFGKFLMGAYYGNLDSLAPCGHSLQRDCLQYYGFGDMVIFLQYSSVQMFSVCLPSSALDDFDTSVAPLLSDAAVVYDNNEPTRAISHVLDSKDYKDQIKEYKESDSSTSDQNASNHITISFEDDSPTVMGKVKKKFSVTCYFAQHFDTLRKRCCIGELDFVRSLSCCSAMGGKTNNGYFAKSLDERFIVKQVTNPEFESFVEFGSKYLKYLIESLRIQIPSCLTKILGVYQVTTAHLNEEDNNKETSTIELMVMENIFFKKKISRIFSLKESARYHDISKITDPNEVLMDMNVSEEVHVLPFFLPHKEKRTLERAVFQDTTFLQGVGITDYFLLIGVDEECQELVSGIFEFFTKYAWDEHVEAWMLFSKHYSDSIFCSGQGNHDSPTIVSPLKFKRRLRKLLSRSFVELFQ